MLELYHNFFDKLCYIIIFDELEINTDSPYLDLAEKELNDWIRPKKETETKKLRSTDRDDSFAMYAWENHFPRNFLCQTQETWEEWARSFQRKFQTFQKAMYLN